MATPTNTASNRVVGALATLVVGGLFLCLVAFRSVAEPTVLMLARRSPGYLQSALVDEAMPMLKLLQRAGYAVEVATSTGDPFAAGALRLNCDVQLSEVRLDRYCAILLPNMGPPQLTVEPIPDSFFTLVREANSRGMIIAAQHLSEVLVGAGMFNRKWALAPGVVRDGNLITSYNDPFTAATNSAPVDTEELIRTLIAAIEGR